MPEAKDRADDDTHVALLAEGELLVERVLIQERVGHGDDAEVEVGRVEQARHGSHAVEARADGLDSALGNGARRGRASRW